MQQNNARPRPPFPPSHVPVHLPVHKLWTWRHPAGHLSQIDYILFRKRWRNSIHNCQAHSSSNSIGSDHRIVTATIQLSLRTRKKTDIKHLNWHALTEDKALADIVD